MLCIVETLWISKRFSCIIHQQNRTILFFQRQMIFVDAAYFTNDMDSTHSTVSLYNQF
jgi:hypothetical protein